MKQIYRRWMEDWENRLCFRTNNRVVRPFEWGVEWAEKWPVARQHPRNGYDEFGYFQMLNERAIAASDDFYSYETPRDFALEGESLRFTSAVRTPFPENNRMHALWYPAEKSRRRAVIVLPHWNAHLEQHMGLCKGIRMLGISALRLSPPYHDVRMPAELHRADYAVSSNIGRTIDATRQAVVDVRSCVDWLEQQGYDRIGIVGTSLGSCYAFLASAHEPRLQVNVFNHCSSYFADVVWTGLSTQHIKQSVEQEIELKCLREVWRAISPVYYMDQFARWPKKSKFIYALYDTTFLPELSRDVIARIQGRGIDNEVVTLPCGHYTLGENPYKYLDGWHICTFLRRWL